MGSCTLGNTCGFGANTVSTPHHHSLIYPPPPTFSGRAAWLYFATRRSPRGVHPGHAPLGVARPRGAWLGRSPAEPRLAHRSHAALHEGCAVLRQRQSEGRPRRARAASFGRGRHSHPDQPRPAPRLNACVIPRPGRPGPGGRSADSCPFDTVRLGDTRRWWGGAKRCLRGTRSDLL